MNCIDKICEYRVLNSGNDTTDFYFCKSVGIEVDDGNCECIKDKLENE
jgi:hypothetical protein